MAFPFGFARPSTARGERTFYTSDVPEEFLMLILDFRRASPVSARLGATALPGLLALETAPVQVRTQVRRRCAGCSPSVCTCLDSGDREHRASDSKLMAANARKPVA